MAGPQDDDAYLEGMERDQLDEIRRLKAGEVEEVSASYIGGDQPFLTDAVAESEAWFAGFSQQEKEWLRTPRVSSAFAADVRESVRQGIEGWLREFLIRILPWSFDLNSVRVPVQAFYGEVDTYEPLGNAQHVIDRIRGVTRHIYEGVNHLGPLMYPDDLLDACRA